MRMVFAGVLMAGGALLTATSALSTAAAADEAAAAMPPPGAPAAGNARRGTPWVGARTRRRWAGTSLQQAGIERRAAGLPQGRHDGCQAADEEPARSDARESSQTHANQTRRSELRQRPSPRWRSRTRGSHRSARLRRRNCGLRCMRLLTPAQKTQLTALEAQWAEHPHHGAGRHGPPHAAE